MSEPPTLKTCLVLIRHGEAISNVEPIVGGPKGDEGLTPLGMRQAGALRDRLAASDEFRPDALMSSTLARARQTAEIIQPALGHPSIIFDDDLQEISVGEADGLSVVAFRERFGLPDFRVDPFRPIAPGGENWGMFTLRVATTLDRIARAYEGKTVMLVCHGGIIDGSFISFMQLPSHQLPPIEFLTINTSITEWQRKIVDGAPGRWRLRRYNDDAHLAGVDHHSPMLWRNAPAGEPAHTASPSPAEAGSEGDA